ncbi:transglutaminase domain-containing protein [Kibdelosporangium philippinense]|uniref:Transglutaminase domain-containing protein n=1 Tax=Kibdelosporangium philippinense TaxID=211113 RepID=A0ABS8Z7L2_9PSEU|nr:transglutaminase-like domain-containing protein [Kibdelosporangium philippinense]MCE7002651.1 transglutaminase domain-containing protein [Kibdelosporangium philippinense]
MLTSPGRHADLFQSLPTDVRALTAIGHGLLIHEYLTHFYDVELSEEDRKTVHIRPVEELLTAITGQDDRPLDIARPPQERTAVNCRHFTALLVSMMQSQGLSARARCGFGSYFNNGFHDDHWVAEYWNGTRWVLVDGQIDDVQMARFPIDFDVTDVPRDRFLTAGRAWQLCRTGKADPDTFGLKMFNEVGYWWIAANMIRDAAALIGMPLLPFDVWGMMPEPEDEVDMEFFDRLAELTEHPAAPTEQLQAMLRNDDRIRVPAKVMNMARKREETIL